MRIAFLTEPISTMRGGPLLILNFGKAVSSQRPDFVVRVYTLGEEDSPVLDLSATFRRCGQNLKVVPVQSARSAAPTSGIHLHDYARTLVSALMNARMFGSLDWPSFVNGTVVSLPRVGVNAIKPAVLLRLLNRLGSDYDILHVGAWSAPYTAAIGISRAFKRQRAIAHAKCVCHALFHPPIAYSMVPPGSIGRIVGPERRLRILASRDRYLMKNVLRSYDATTVSTQYEQQELQRCGLRNVRLTEEGVDLDYIDSIRTQALKKGKEIRDDLGVDRLALFIGAKAVTKGYPHLLQAIKSLHRQDEKLCLISLGQYTGYYPSEDRQIMNLESRLVGEGIVKSYHNVSELDKYALIAASDLVAIPSLIETVPLVFLEAWAMEKPVIGALTPSLQSVITMEGDGGLLVPFGDAEAIARAMHRLFNDANYARALGLIGLQKVKTSMNLKEVGRRLVQLYFELV